MKSQVEVGYSKSDLERYQTLSLCDLTGADIKARDGLGNEIEVYVRNGRTGYRIVLNGKTIAEN